MSARFSTILVSLVLLSAACGPNQRILESANANVTSSDATPSSGANSTPIAPPTFEQDLEAMRTADFKFILVFRRKDGKVLEPADKEMIRQTGFQENRRRLADSGRAVIIGSNFPFPPGTFDVLSERFTTENFSKPDSGPMFSNSIPNS